MDDTGRSRQSYIYISYKNMTDRHNDVMTGHVKRCRIMEYETTVRYSEIKCCTGSSVSIDSIIYAWSLE